MLKELRLKNIVLIESAEIPFHEGFNAISGETGSGKSAILNSLSLIAGDRADISIIRRGAEKGTIEALFDISRLPGLIHLLEESGIDHDGESELLIRRDLNISGKSRAFINNQPTQLNLLQQIAKYLFDIVGQHANQRLLALDAHRNILDSFAELHVELVDFAESWQEETQLAKAIEEIIQSENKRTRDLETCLRELEELQEANLKEGEEEELFLEYTLLSNSEELTTKIEEITNALSLPSLGKLKSTFDRISHIDPTLAETSSSFHHAIIELQEISHTLNRYQSRIEYNPERLVEINERLTMIEKLKRKYGSSINEMQSYMLKLKERQQELENKDLELEQLQQRLQHIKQTNHQLAEQLTLKRKKAAAKFEKDLISHLCALNMPKVEFHVSITPQNRTRYGDDKIEFFLTPNVGEHKVSIRECASGGELSRVMLAIQALLAGKEKIPTLVFDEIDSNIGGETASVIGEKLKEIGQKHQVLCITHFPQVARKAQHHLQISKQEKEGRTLTIIKNLDKSSRDQELLRMSGG